MNKKLVVSLIAIIAALGCASATDEDLGTLSSQLKPLSWDVAVPSQASAAAAADECSNAPGPYVTLDGAISLGSVSLRLVFKNNVKGTHQRTVDVASVDVTLIPEGESIVIPKQPVLGGVGGNPFIWVQLVSSDGTALTDEQLLGRCVQGLEPVDLVFGSPGVGLLKLLSVECSNSPGPVIEVEGSLSLEGVSARIIFRNSLTGPHEYVVTKELSIVADGLDYSFPKQPVLGGVGGNPLIYAQFVAGDGSSLTDETLLGRCVQLSK